MPLGSVLVSESNRQTRIESGESIRGPMARWRMDSEHAGSCDIGSSPNSEAARLLEQAAAPRRCAQSDMKSGPGPTENQWRACSRELWVDNCELSAQSVAVDSHLTAAASASTCQDGSPSSQADGRQHGLHDTGPRFWPIKVSERFDSISMCRRKGSDETRPRAERRVFSGEPPEVA